MDIVGYWDEELNSYIYSDILCYFTAIIEQYCKNIEKSIHSKTRPSLYTRSYPTPKFGENDGRVDRTRAEYILSGSRLGRAQCLF